MGVYYRIAWIGLQALWTLLVSSESKASNEIGEKASSITEIIWRQKYIDNAITKSSFIFFSLRFYHVPNKHGHIARSQF
jgi:hypothetical protein